MVRVTASKTKRTIPPFDFLIVQKIDSLTIDVRITFKEKIIWTLFGVALQLILSRDDSALISVALFLISKVMTTNIPSRTHM